MLKKRSLTSVCFMIIMLALGANDAMRGLFATIFEDHFSLSMVQVSMIVTVSYMGNLVFLLLGGILLDKWNRKKATIAFWMLWMLAILIYLVSDNYLLLLLGMFLAMGASTLMNTTINILTPSIYIVTPGLMVNIFFFVQGIGTSFSQAVVGKFAQGFLAWKIVNVIFFIMGILGFLLLCILPIPESSLQEERSEKKKPSGKLYHNPSLYLLITCFGLYFIAEHGIMNWLIIYCEKYLNYSVAKSSTYLSVFWAGMTIGRFVFAPFVQKKGIFQSITLFGIIGTFLYVTGVIIGGKGLILLSLSGFALSIIYPTMVLMIQDLFPKNIAATVTGIVISVATVFDILFNTAFGVMVDNWGYGISFSVLPVCLIGFLICYFVMYRRKEIAE